MRGRRTITPHYALALCLLGAAAGVSAQQRAPAERAREAALARRVVALAQAASLTPEQARSVFAQILSPPYEPRFHDVRSVDRPDGSRGVFALVDVDRYRECVLEDILEAHACRERRRTDVYLLFVGLSREGRVTRTCLALPFTRIPERLGGTQYTRPVALRLFSPAPDAPPIALVEGVTLVPRPIREEDGSVSPPSYTHALFVWNGREGYDLELSTVSRPNDPVTLYEGIARVDLDEDRRSIVRVQASCEDGCRCTMPSTITAEAAQVTARARQGGRCGVTELEHELRPALLRFIDDDLDARAPRLTRQEALVARVTELARAAGIEPASAEATLRMRSTIPISARFGRFVSRPGADGERHVYGVVERSDFEECVYARRDISAYDALRACAHETRTQLSLLYLRLSAEGEVRAAEHRGVGGALVALHLLPSEEGSLSVGVETTQTTEHRDGRWYTHELTFFRDGRRSGSELVSFAGDERMGRRRSDTFVGELVTREARDGTVALTRRRAPCSPSCPCVPVPTSPSEAHAFLEARASSGECAVRMHPLR